MGFRLKTSKQWLLEYSSRLSRIGVSVCLLHTRGGVFLGEGYSRSFLFLDSVFLSGGEGCKGFQRSMSVNLRNQGE